MPVSLRLIVPAAVLLLGVAVVVGWKYGKPILEERTQVSTSDAVKSKGTITIGTDNFIGYYPLFSPYLQSLMRNEGYALVGDDDKADYAKRMQKLKDGKIDFAVATVDSYELNAVKTAFPGSIVMVIDVSQGADAIVSCRSSIKNIDDLKKGGLKIAFTPNSPSEHLIKANATHFDIPQLRGGDKTWRIETEGSAEAAKKCAAGVADVAVLWEPDITKLLRSNPQTTKIIGTESTSRLIVDVLIVRREYARDRPDVVKLLMRNYFLALHYYRQNPDVAAAHAAKFADISPDVVKDAMKGVQWVNLGENWLLWFGGAEPGQHPQYGLIETIESTTRILIESGDFTKSPLPNGDPRYIVLSGFVEELYQTGMGAGEQVDLKSGDTLGREFSELSDEAWTRLREVGTLRVRPVMFQSGIDELSIDAKQNIDEIVKAIKSYPNFRILIEGHTSTRGDPAVNLELSQDRAEAVARYLMVTYGIKQSRIHAAGYGGRKPLPKRLDESEREYLGRLSRVAVKLVTEAY